MISNILHFSITRRDILEAAPPITVGQVQDDALIDHHANPAAAY